MKTDNFCPVLWMHLHIINDGRAFPCCITPLEDENSFGNVNEQPLIEIMNHPKAKEMRANMLQGKPLPQSCHRCTEKEALGMNSYRVGFVDTYSKISPKLIKNTQPNGTIDKVELISWDFRFSNYCNLSCRTCAPLFSTSWKKDFKVLWGKDDKSSALINLENADLFWKDLEEQINYVEVIHFAGGEPMIMEEHWRLLDMLIEKGMTNVALKYSTNCTILTYKGRNIIDLWKKFKDVHLSLSIDGAHETFDYVRNRGSWVDVEENLKAIKKSGVDFWIHPTISVLNIYRIPELHDRLLEMNIIKPNFFTHMANYFVTRFHLNPLFGPEYYSLTSLPAKHKEQVKALLTDYAEKMYKEYKIPKDGWESIINFMYSRDTSHTWPEFVSLTKRLDTIRTQDFIKINPEFIEDFK